MNFDDKKQFYKTKGFYVCCFLGLFALLAIVGIQKSMESNQLANSDTQSAQTEYSENTVLEEANADLEHNFDAVNPDEDTTPLDIAEFEEEDSSSVSDDLETSEEGTTPKTDSAVTGTPEDASNEETNTNVETEIASAQEEEDTVAVLSTEDQNQGLTWPVDGSILLPYSMDKSVYFATLSQYKCNPALIIGGTEGENVVSACDCKITDISRNEETGLTITASANGYEFIYGQLSNPKFAEGDIVKEGEIIGTLSTPSKYYKKEGCNLYFQVLEDGESVNPLLLLK